MLLSYCLLLVIFIILNTETDLIDGRLCSCNCGLNICHELERLGTSVNANIYDRRKWNRHYDFVRDFHASWKQEMRSLFEEEINKYIQNLEGAKQSSRITEEFINGSKAVSSISTRNDKLENEIFVLSSRLQVVEDLSKQLKNDLLKEKEDRKELETDLRKLSVIEKQNKELEGKISGIESKLVAAEFRDIELEISLQKERESKKLRMDALMSTTGRRNDALEKKISVVEAKVRTVEARAVKLEMELQTEKDATKSEDNRQIQSIERRNEVLGKRISAVEEKIRAADSRALIFESDLKKEKESRKNLENNSNKIPILEVRSEEFKNRISGIEGQLRTSEDKAKNFASLLNRERDARIKLEIISNKIPILEVKSEKLMKRISGIEGKLRTAENKAMIFDSVLNRERDARMKLENKLRRFQFSGTGNFTSGNLQNHIPVFEETARETEVRRLPFDANQRGNQETIKDIENDFVLISDTLRKSQNFDKENSRKIKSLENRVDESEEMLHKLDNHTMLIKNELIKEQQLRIKIQKSVLEIQSAVLATVKILRANTPRKKFRDLKKELDKTQPFFDKWVSDFGEWQRDINRRSHLSSPYVTTDAQQSKAYKELNHDLENLKESMSTLNTSVANVLSSIAVLKNKDKDEVISLESNKEIDVTQPHQSVLIRRQFDVQNDP